jgi:hypothetical protein
MPRRMRPDGDHGGEYIGISATAMCRRGRGVTTL